MARPSKINKEAIKEVTRWLKRGHFRDYAIALSGLKRRTVLDWIEKGEKLSSSDKEVLSESEELCVELFDEVLKAEGIIQDRSLCVILDLPKVFNEPELDKGSQPKCKDDYKKHAWFLSRRFRNLWGDNPKLETEDSKDIQLVINCETDLPEKT